MKEITDFSLYEIAKIQEGANWLLCVALAWGITELCSGDPNEELRTRASRGTPGRKADGR